MDNDCLVVIYKITFSNQNYLNNFQVDELM